MGLPRQERRRRDLGVGQPRDSSDCYRIVHTQFDALGKVGGRHVQTCRVGCAG